MSGSEITVQAQHKHGIDCIFQKSLMVLILDRLLIMELLTWLRNTAWYSWAVLPLARNPNSLIWFPTNSSKDKASPRTSYVAGEEEMDPLAWNSHLVIHSRPSSCGWGTKVLLGWYIAVLSLQEGQSVCGLAFSCFCFFFFFFPSYETPGKENCGNNKSKYFKTPMPFNPKPSSLCGSMKQLTRIRIQILDGCKWAWPRPHL